MSWTLILKTLRDRWRNAAGWAGIGGLMAVIQLYIYPSIKDSADAMDKFIEVFPKELIAMFRIEDYTSSVGFLGTELYSMMIPMVFIALGASWGASAAAEEEERGTSEILYALPIRREQVLLSKLVAAWLVFLAAGSFLVVEITIGSGIVELNLEGVDLIAATVSCLGLGVFFHGLAMAIGAITGHRGVSIGASIGLGLLSFLIFALAPMVDTFDDILPFNPFEWALGQNPLKDGFDWPGLGWLALGGLAGYAVALVAIDRRDLDA